MFVLDENFLILGNHIFYTVYFLIGILSHALLFYLMIRNTTKSIKPMRFFLLNSLIIQTVTVASSAFTQCRTVPNDKTIGFLCAGPCKLIGANSCQNLFHILQTSLTASATSLFVAFYYRYKLLKTGEVGKLVRFKLLLMSYIFPAVALIVELCGPSDYNIIKTEIELLHPTYSLDKYAIIGFSDTTGLVAIVSTTMLVGVMYGTPFIAIYYKKKILKVIKSGKYFKTERIEQSKSMISGLMIQTILPVIFYLPVLTYYIFAQYAKNTNIIAEFLTSPFSLLSSLIDPILTIHFVLPYRKAFRKMIHLNIEHQASLSHSRIVVAVAKNTIF